MELSTVLSTIIASVALVCSLTAVVLGYVAIRITQVRSVRSISLRRMAKLEGEMTDTIDALHAVRESMHKMRSRQNMQKLRSNGKVEHNADDEPTDPEEWHRWATAKYLRQPKGQ